MLDINVLKNRKEPIKYTKILKDGDSNVINSKKEKLYKYYKCDYCGDEIRLDRKQHERSGGTIILSNNLTKCGELTLALHNKCLKSVLKEIENNKTKEEYRCN